MRRNAGKRELVVFTRVLCVGTLQREAANCAKLQNELTPELTPNFTTESAQCDAPVSLGHQEGKNTLGIVPKSLYSLLAPVRWPI
jgi:hypothetical protein